MVVDQELSLFYDTPPLLSITELEGPVPDDDALWRATSSSAWRQALQAPDDSVPATITALRNRPRSSLRDLFHFLSSNDTQRPEMAHLTPFHLRLLLYPLHALVSSFHQSLGLSSTMNQPLKLHKTMTQMSTMLQHAEIKSLLHRWRELADAAATRQRTNLATLDAANLVLFHLVALNLFASFREIEAYARACAAAAATPGPSSALPASWLCDPEEVLVHCGQVLRLLRAIEPARRPIWWAAAAYRAALVLWAYSASTEEKKKGGERARGGAEEEEEEEEVPIDALPWEDASVQGFLRHRQGVPVLTRAGGERVGLGAPQGVLAACIEMLELGPMRCLVWEGVKCKLRVFARACAGATG